MWRCQYFFLIVVDMSDRRTRLAWKPQSNREWLRRTNAGSCVHNGRVPRTAAVTHGEVFAIKQPQLYKFASLLGDCKPDFSGGARNIKGTAGGENSREMKLCFNLMLRWMQFLSLGDFQLCNGFDWSSVLNFYQLGCFARSEISRSTSLWGSVAHSFLCPRAVATYGVPTRSLPGHQRTPDIILQSLSVITVPVWTLW